MAIPFERPTTITRTSAGAYVSGTWVPGTEYPVYINATVLPEKNAEIIAQLGGTNLDGVITIRSHSELIAADEATAITGDKLTYDGRQYEVTTISRYRDVIPHYRAWAVLRDDKES